MTESRLDKLWRYNRITGYWEYVRDCYKENTASWLRIFSGDEPETVFKASRNRPSGRPTNLPPSTVGWR
jgi:hypothetical protein